MSEQSGNSTAVKAPAKAAPFRMTTRFYTIAIPVLRFLFAILAPIRFYHKERLETLEGPAILIGNHKSFADPLVIAVAMRPQVSFMAKKELLKNPFAGWVMRHLHVIPVDRHNTDMNAMRTSLRVLKEKGFLGIFPEGTRHKEGVMRDLDSGAAMIALRSGAPVIPMLILPQFRFFHRNHCYVGEAIPTEDLRAEGISKETCDKLTARITETYVRLQAEMADAAAKK